MFILCCIILYCDAGTAVVNDASVHLVQLHSLHLMMLLLSVAVVSTSAPVGFNARER